MSNDNKTIEISEILRSNKSTVSQFLEASNGYKEYICNDDHRCDDSQYTLFLARTAEKIRHLVEMGLNPETRIYKLNGIVIFPFEVWKDVNSSKSRNGITPENV